MIRHLVIFGFGYTGAAIARAAVALGCVVTLTTRRPDRLPQDAGGAQVIPFDRAARAILTATHILSTVPPPGDGGEADGSFADPVIAAYGEAIRSAPDLRWLGYLSTTGVYGDHQGRWVDEATAVSPSQERSRRRLAAEQEWISVDPRRPVDLFRVAGIYGPGRSPFAELRAGRGRRVLKPGHCFGRIHRDDIAGAVAAALDQERRSGTRVLHLSDDLPAEPASVIEEASRLIGVPAPAPVVFEDAFAAMSDIGRTFWLENRKVASAKTQAMLGRVWSWPTYRDGLRAILAEEASAG